MILRKIFLAVYVAMFTVIALLVLFAPFDYEFKTNFLVANWILAGLFIAAVLIFCFATKDGKRRWSLSNRALKNTVSLSAVLLILVQAFIIRSVFFRTYWDVNNLFRYADLEVVNPDDAYFNQNPNNVAIAVVFRLIRQALSWLPIHVVYYIITCIGACLVVVAGVFMVLSLKELKASNKLALLSWSVFGILGGLNPWILVPYSDTYSIAFVAASVYFFLRFQRTRKNVNLAVVGILAIVGYTVKPTVIFVIIGILAFWLYKALSKQENLVVLLKSTAVLALCSLATFILVSFGVSSLSGLDLDHDRSYSWTHYLMMGINDDTGGAWSQEDQAISRSASSYEDRQHLNLKTYVERVEDYGPVKVATIYTKKMMTAYGSAIFSWGRESGHNFYYHVSENPFGSVSQFFRDVYYDDNYGTPAFAHSVFKTVLQFFWLAILICLPFAALKLKKKEDYLVPMCVLVGITLFLVLFEVRGRYLIPFLPCFFIVASLGLSNGVDLIRSMMGRSFKHKQFR